MPIFEIQSPDGKTYEIDATDQAAALNAWQGFSASKPSVMGDMFKSAGSGLVKGAAGLVGLPNTIGTLGAAGIDKATNAIGGLLGVDVQRPSFETGFTLPTTEGVTKAIEENVTGPLHKPQTTAGEYTQTAAEFVPGALLAPGGMAANAIRFGIVPGLASEAAGQATKGSPYETVARVGGALAGAGGAAALSRPGTTAQAIRGQMPSGVTPQMVNQAETLIADAAAQGVTLTWPEALSQVAQRPVMSNLARHLEAAPATEARMAELYGARPQQMETAGRAAMGNIAPPNTAPSTIGPQVGRAAEETVGDVRRTINQAAEPFYQASEGVLLDAPTMARVRALPGYAEAAATVRNEPQLNRYVAHLPENSVGFLNEVKKQLDQSARNATAPLGPRGAPNVQIGAGFTRDAETARNIGIGASQNYEIALGVEQQARQQFLDPLLQGPLGKIASRDTTTRKAIEALFPHNPLPNSEQEIGTAVRALAHRNPNAAGDLVRAHAESVFNEATQALQSGANQAGAAKFRAVLVGNPQQRANFEAAVSSLPYGAQRLAGFNRFLDIAEATGTRQNIGSKTAYNVEFLKDASRSNLLGEAAKGTANPLGRGAQFLADKYERWRLGQNLNELADILTNPAAAGRLRAIARMPANSPQAQVIALRLANLTRSGATSGTPVQQPRQQP